MNGMKRINKAALLMVRKVAYRGHFLRPYYWADRKLFELRTVYVMPLLYYRWLYQWCMWLIASNRFQRLADRAIHTIPYHVRFKVA
jgi:hypothetical protein